MARVRYRAMYITSVASGYLLAGVMFLAGARWREPVAGLVRHTARRHAIDAARKRGPYLAPVTFFVTVAGVAVFGALLIRALP